MKQLPSSLLLLWLAACGGGEGAPAVASPAPTPAPTPAAAPRVTTFASGLVNPWGLAFLPDGSMLVTERPGRLRRVSADGRSVSAPIAGLPALYASGQGGLFDVVVARDFATSRRIWLSYAEPGTGPDAGRNGTAVGTAVLDAGFTTLAQWQVIYRQAPKVASGGHFGGRMAMSGDGRLFVTLGERQSNSERVKAQDLSTGHGKVVRIGADGSVPSDNPFVGTGGAQPAIWSYGHRNPQGATIHPTTGELWTVEHGPQGGDEINRTLPGRNYGWPNVSYGCEYGAPAGNCAPVGGASNGPGYEPPVSYWVPTSIAPSGMVFYTGDRFPEWRGQLFVGALAGRALWRLEMSGNQVRAREAMFTSLGLRIRDVREGPGGWLYLLTDESDGAILRIER